MVIYSSFYQAKFTNDPNRGLGPVPPRDPVLNRLFEVRPLYTAFHCDVTSRLRAFCYMDILSRYALPAPFLVPRNQLLLEGCYSREGT